MRNCLISGLGGISGRIRCALLDSAGKVEEMNKAVISVEIFDKSGQRGANVPRVVGG